MSTIKKQEISIHSLVRGRTALQRLFGQRKSDFNPLPRKRENPTCGGTSRKSYHFNPLPRKRENFACSDKCCRKIKISIHSLVRGRTEKLRKGSIMESISIHSLVRGRTLYRCSACAHKSDFNPLPRKRENIGTACGSYKLSDFNPLPRKRENNDCVLFADPKYLFQSTPS